MAPPETTWEDFVQLGKTKREIFLKLNDQRGGTMGGEHHLHLNDDLTKRYGYYCYNAIKGQVTKVSSSPISRESTTVIRTWDNTGNDDQSMSVNETIVKDAVHTVTLTTTESAKIKLGRSITVENVANSGISLTVGTETDKESKYERKDPIYYNASVTVKPREKVELLQTETEKGEDAVYHVPYGASSSDDWIGTQGEKYNGHYYWFYRFNSYFGNPTPNIVLKGSSKKTSYSFKLKRTGGKGTKATYVSLAGDNLDFISDDGTPVHDLDDHARPGF
ncbi:hypothetical protein APHAL10511_002935 [Amanita phalloides]|nr:hypothetical protein APHAL10511_002935 [Amanita phalloides]